MSDKTNVFYHVNRYYDQNIDYKLYTICPDFSKFYTQSKDDPTFDSRHYNIFIKNRYFEIQ